MATYKGIVRLLNSGDCQALACFDWRIGEVYCLAFSPDGMTLAAGGERDIVAWDLDENLVS